MGYNRDDLIRVKAEYREKYQKARRNADMRAEEIYLKIPRVREIDITLSKTALEIMSAVTNGKESADEALARVRQRNDALMDERCKLLLSAGYPEDYTDVHYDCEKCGDSGYIDGKMCECMKRELIMAGYESSGLGRLIAKQSFENFSLDYYKTGGANYQNMELYFSSLRAFAQNFSVDTYKNFLLIGGTGLGKTHLSTAVAKTVIERGYDVFYVCAIDMFSDFEQKQFGNGEDNTRRYFDCDLLIIDDLGTELTNQFTVSCLYNVINSRINTARSTFINTNLSKKDIETKYSERITSRLFGEYYPLVFTGIDIRKQKMM
ncbi:MAG: AAA family ATPase [Ruminococcaceae bacterium]|nr:AAA family ATPase [Oscillospiraceae bacterium]